MSKMSVITSKAIELNEEQSHYFAMKTIELNAVRMGILDIAVGFDEKFRLYIVDKKKNNNIYMLEKTK